MMKGKSNDILPGAEPTVIYKLNLSAIQIGDIILTATPGTQSRLIRAVTGGDYSHAILVVKHPNGIESSDFGVVRFRLDRFAIRNKQNIKVLRLKGAKPKNFDNIIKQFANDQTAKEYAEYDVLTALFSAVPRFEKQRYFCSQLIAASFKEAAVPGFEQIKPEKFSPETLASSELFQMVEGALIETNISEFKFKPAYLDGINEQSPNERLTVAKQNVIKSVQSVYDSYGIKIGNLDEALIELSNFYTAGLDAATEIDRALYASMVHNRISELGRDCWPATSDSFFIDFDVSNAINYGGMGTDKQKELLDFYANEVVIAKETLRERDEFIDLLKIAYLRSGLASLRYYLAGCWDFYIMHRRCFFALERSVEMLERAIARDQAS